MLYDTALNKWGYPLWGRFFVFLLFHELVLQALLKKMVRNYGWVLTKRISVFILFFHCQRDGHLVWEMLGLSVLLLDYSVVLANFNNQAFNYWVVRGEWGISGSGTILWDAQRLGSTVCSFLLESFSSCLTWTSIAAICCPCSFFLLDTDNTFILFCFLYDSYG